jgi:hypothetical protein
MDFLLVLLVGVALGAGLGLLAGAALGARRTYEVIGRRAAATRSAATGFASIGLESLPQRAAADIIAGRVTILLGGFPYTLKVLPRDANAEWRAELDAQFADLVTDLEAAGDDKPAILERLLAHPGKMLDAIRRYDVDDVLPNGEWIDRFATDPEIRIGLVEVWRAANPLAAILTETAGATTGLTSSEQPSTQPSPTAGVHVSSPVSPTSSSSTTSMQRPSD